MTLKQQIDDKKLNPNTARNRIKPIKTLLRANEIDFSWFLIDKMMPKESKSEDREYTHKEIKQMIIHCEDITDKVIITGFSCAGFRLEAWNYFTWSDVVFFKNEDDTYKGGALRIYHGLRNEMIPGKQRYVVQLDHGFRKYFNTMLRRAKVDFADKEDMILLLDLN